MAAKVPAGAMIVELGSGLVAKLPIPLASAFLELLFFCHIPPESPGSAS